MSYPIVGFEDDRMCQRTIGTVKHDGKIYEIDWRYYEENGQIIACEPVAWVIKDGYDVTNFCNPCENVDGWATKADVMNDARAFITEGHMTTLLARKFLHAREVF